MKKLFLVLGLSLLLTTNGFCVWNAAKPADNEKLKDTPALIRANWDAVATGTDSALQITNAKISATAGIVDTKLATISTAGKVNATAITALSSMPSGAGALPILNGGTGQTTATAGLTALLPTQTGNSGKALITNATVQSWGYPADLAITSQAQGDLLYFDGTNWVRLGAGTAGNTLKTGGAGANPAWASLNLAGSSAYVTGTLPVGNGGTGATAAANAANGVVVLNASSQLPAVSGALLTNLPAGVQDTNAKFVRSIMISPPNGVWTDITGLSTSITLSRTGTIFATFSGTGSWTGGGWCDWRIVYDSTTIAQEDESGSSQVLGMGGKATSVSAGTYTVKMQVLVGSNGMTVTTTGILTVIAY